MKHILGMAKSHLDLRGAKGPKLELDFLRLVYAVKELRSKQEKAVGYLLVMNQNIANRAESWKEKYEAGDTLIISIAKLTPDEKERLQAEKKSNVAGMIAGSLGKDVGSQSDAVTGMQLGERELIREIWTREGEVVKITDEGAFPFGIRWDFYGQSGTS